MVKGQIIASDKLLSGFKRKGVYFEEQIICDRMTDDLFFKIDPFLLKTVLKIRMTVLKINDVE